MEVVVEAAIGNVVSSVRIPVAVFKDDKMLINAEEETDYFVPWVSELDVNRILLVENRMTTYGCPDTGFLDRSVRFSPWQLVEPIHEVILTTPGQRDTPLLPLYVVQSARSPCLMSL